MNKRRKKYSRRINAPKAAAAKAAPFWQSFLGLPGGGAMITAVLGLVSLVLAFYLNLAAQKNSNVAQQETAEIQKIKEAYDSYLKEQREFVFGAATLVGRCFSASDGLIALTDPAFAPSRYKGIEPQRLEMRKTFNDCASRWNEEYSALNIGMSYYHGGQPAVAAAWDGVQQATTGLMNCAQQWYVSHNTGPVPTAGVCKAEKDEFNRRFGDFKREIGAARRYAWQQRGAADAASEAAPGKKPAQVELIEQ